MSKRDIANKMMRMCYAVYDGNEIIAEFACYDIAVSFARNYKACDTVEIAPLPAYRVEI